MPSEKVTSGHTESTSGLYFAFYGARHEFFAIKIRLEKSAVHQSRTIIIDRSDIMNSFTLFEYSCHTNCLRFIFPCPREKLKSNPSPVREQGRRRPGRTVRRVKIRSTVWVLFSEGWLYDWTLKWRYIKKNKYLSNLYAIWFYLSRFTIFELQKISKNCRIEKNFRVELPGFYLKEFSSWDNSGKIGAWRYHKD